MDNQKQIPPFNVKVSEHAKQLCEFERKYNTDQKKLVAGFIIIGVEAVEPDRINIEMGGQGNVSLVAKGIARTLLENPDMMVSVLKHIAKANAMGIDFTTLNSK